MKSSDFFLSVHKGEVRRYKAGKNSARSVATATPSLHMQQKVKGHCSLIQRSCHLPDSQLLLLAHSTPGAAGLQAGPEGTGRKPKHLWAHEPSYHEHSFHTGFEGSFKGFKPLRLLGQLPFRGMGQYLTGHYTELKQTTIKYITASASRNSCRAAAYQAQAWGKTRSLINSLERGNRPQLRTTANTTLPERIQSEPAEEQNSKKEERFAQPGHCKTPHKAENTRGSSAKKVVIFWPSQLSWFRLG